MSKLQKPSAFVSRQVESSRLFFLDAEDDGDISVVFGGFERCRTDYRIDRRSIPWFCLEFVNRGSGILHLGGADHDLRPGSFFLYGPSLPHRIVSSPENPLGKYFVGFTGSGVEAFLRRYDMEPGMVARCIKGEPIRRTFDTLIDRGVRKSALARPLCAMITCQLLMMCRDDAAGPVNTDSPAFLTYTRARECIEGHYLELATLEAVADACGTEPAYLCRLFSRYHDESPYQFLTRLRMDHASRLLLDGASSVKSVAVALGFKDAFHFSRVFKSLHHVPPSRFRQAMHPQWQG
ncbi:MAG: AraC family transcriptional regulator [Verrucomicrobiota bacterium]